jgi:hypothetical protein
MTDLTPEGWTALVNPEMPKQKYSLNFHSGTGDKINLRATS